LVIVSAAWATEAETRRESASVERIVEEEERRRRVRSVGVM
jgi:hypothetical protein